MQEDIEIRKILFNYLFLSSLFTEKLLKWKLYNKEKGVLKFLDTDENIF